MDVELGVFLGQVRPHFHDGRKAMFKISEREMLVEMTSTICPGSKGKYTLDGGIPPSH